MAKAVTLKKALVIMAVIAVAGVAYALYVWYKPARDVKDEKAVSITAQQIFDAYSKDEKSANTLYLDKAIQVSGEVKSIKTNQQGKTVVMLKTGDEMFGVQCTLKEAAALKEGDQVTIKGICTGYLMDVVLIDCFVVK